MLDASIYCAYPNSFPSDSAHRCRRCGGGPVMGSDGFMMDHCMNCGNWQAAAASIDLGFGRLKDAAVKLFQKAKAGTIRLLGLKNGGAELAVTPGS